MRRRQSADRAFFATMNADQEVMRYFPAPLNRAGSDALVNRIESRFEAQGFGLWALERRDDQVFLGFAGLNPMPPGTPGAGEVEVGGASLATPGEPGMPRSLGSRRSGWPSVPLASTGSGPSPP